MSGTSPSNTDREPSSSKMDSRYSRLPVPVAACLAIAAYFAVPDALAVSSFSRETGMTCVQCHTSFPELTAAGRDFKLNAFTGATDQSAINQASGGGEPGLGLLNFIPISASFHADVTATRQRQPGRQNPSVEAPEALNLYLAGQLTPHFGTFIQLTYASSNDHFTVDMSDVRYSNETTLAGKSVVWGIDANNSPTYEDLWNSVPGNSFPYDATVDSAGFVPGARAILDGPLVTQVIGSGPYAMWDNHLYGLVELYRSQHIGVSQPDTGANNPINIQAAAPYWRFAWQQDLGKSDYLEAGVYGIYVRSTPNFVNGTADRYTDIGADLTYERTQDNGDLFVLHGLYLHETNTLRGSAAQGMAAQARHNLNTFRFDAAYHFGHRLTLTAGSFITSGTSDNLLFAPGAVSGYANGSPNNSGYIGQVGYWPWQNFEIGAQYRSFTRYNGSDSNYDGAGRNASANNTLYVFVWWNL